MEASKMEERRLVWKTVDKSGPVYNSKKTTDSNNIKPMQIKVFVVEFTP
jgi:hypothetical protein